MENLKRVIGTCASHEESFDERVRKIFDKILELMKDQDMEFRHREDLDWSYFECSLSMR